MRKELQKLGDKRRFKFNGKFERLGTKINWKGYPEKTVLLSNIRDANGKVISDHLWFNYTKGFRSLGELKEGDMIEFHARVNTYIKGYVSHRDYTDERSLDYRLSYPTRFKRRG